MIKKITIKIVMALLCLNFCASAQHIVTQIKGTVSDKTGRPLPGATVKIQQSKETISTDKDGHFILKSDQTLGRLTISFMGYISTEVTFDTNHLNLSIVMTEESGILDEVQVMGYGQTTRRLNTGSIGTVKAVDIENQPVSNPLAVLQGRVAGLMVSQNSGVPGSSFKVQIRGQSALDLNLSKNDPLFIIDGVPFEPGNMASNRLRSAANSSAGDGGISPLNTISPQDIESIDILKDADATSIYGSRGANGVVLITTKKGKSGKTSFGLNLYTGISQIGNSMDMLDTKQYVSVRKEALANDGLVPSANSTDPGYAPDIMVWDTTRYTDFKDLFIGGNAYTQNVNATLSGGNESTNFRIGGNYRRETTVFSNDFSDVVASLRFSLQHSSTNKRFNITFSGGYSADNNNLPGFDLTRYINLPPNLKLYNDDGSLAFEDRGIVYNTVGDFINPLSYLMRPYSSMNENLNVNLLLSYRLIKGLSLKANMGYNSFHTDESLLNPKAAISPNLVDLGVLGSSEFNIALNRSWILEPQLEYHADLKKSSFTVLVGGTIQDKLFKRNSMTGSNYSSDLLLGSISAAGSISASNNQSDYRYAAIFGRLNYSYDGQYILNLSVRRDGSSRFGPDRQWANFGAVGAAWLFSRSHFTERNLPFLSFGKLRGSYGTTGNDQIGDYRYLNLWGSTSTGYNGLAGLVPQSLFNPAYSWEVNKKFELALELGFLKDRLFLTAAYYNNRSGNQLINYVLPAQTGFSSVVSNFPAKVQNSGLELTLETRNIQAKDFGWTTSFNLSVPKNKLLSFPGLATSSYRLRYIEGQSLNLLQGLKYLGVDPQTGVYRFEDSNGDGQYTTADYQLFGNLDPRFYGGLQNTIRLGGFDLGFFFQFTKQKGSSYLNQLGSYKPGSVYNQPLLVLDRWQKPGDISAVQRFTSSFEGSASTAQSLLIISDGAYTDASFIKLKNVTLGYHFPDKILKKLKMNSCRIFMEAQNLLTISNYLGADPESQNITTLPPLRTVAFGLQLNF